MRVCAVVLAAGGSRRLGRAKQVAVVDGETLLGRTLRVVYEAGVDSVVVVLGARAEEIVADVDLRGARVVVNPDWETGIASSIRAGVLASGNVDGVLMLVCDQARLSSEHLRELLKRFDGDGVVASGYAGIVGIPAVFPKAMFGQLMRLEGDAGARVLLREYAGQIEIVPWADGVVDVDTAEDLSAL
jgi:molybdenum cofactor cytidylyltransferase